LKGQGYNVVAVEPNMESHPEFVLMTADQALEQADVLAVLVKHRQFLKEPMQAKMHASGALDFCGCLQS
jgi:UDP-N-acetyl-D-mannosaminuronic acid dehydrogenase